MEMLKENVGEALQDNDVGNDPKAQAKTQN